MKYLATTFIFYVFPFILFSQTNFDFKTSQETLGWVLYGGKKAKAAITSKGFDIGWDVSSSSKLRLENMNIDIKNTPVFAITLNINSYELKCLRFTHTSGNEVRSYLSKENLFRTDQSVTFYYDLNHSEFQNNSDQDEHDFFELCFLGSGHLKMESISHSKDLVIEKIQFLKSIPEIVVSAYLFETESQKERWHKYSPDSKVENGRYTVTTNKLLDTKVNYKIDHINESGNQYVKVVANNKRDKNHMKLVNVDDRMLFNQAIIPNVLDEFSKNEIPINNIHWTGNMSNLGLIFNSFYSSYKTMVGDVIIESMEYSDEGLLVKSKLTTKHLVTTKYPDAFTDLLYVNTKYPIQYITIYKSSGEKIKSVAMSDTIMVSDIPDGIYSIEIISRSGKEASQFIKG